MVSLCVLLFSNTWCRVLFVCRGDAGDACMRAMGPFMLALIYMYMFIRMFTLRCFGGGEKLSCRTRDMSFFA